MSLESSRLTDGAAALGLSPSNKQIGALLAYLELLRKWNRVYNLTAIRDPSRMLEQHLLDSLTIVEPLRRWSGGNAKHVLDVGSGAGLPGIVIATLIPAFDVTCVDAVSKKASFVRQVAAELELRNLHSLHTRVESLAHDPFEMITSRAFAALAEFTALTRHLLAPGGTWLAMKGKYPTNEIDALPAQTEMFHVEQVRVRGLEADRCLVWMRAQG
ncbi:MAG: 16S rRNA (guanine(527)-N(7))-methyltransferase RsmG [Burkholderiales bacterium]